MYKTILYGLILLIICAFIVSFIGNLPFPPLFLLFSLVTVFSVCFVSNFVLAKIFKAPTNSESYIITALILFFLFLPPTNGISGIIPLALASFLAMTSKYILTIKKKHIFNPAAISAVLMTFLGFGASWWVATPVMLPAVFIVGFLIIRKVRKFSLFFTFSTVVVIEMLIFGFTYNLLPQKVLTQLFLSWPFMFFASIMLTEPLTMPPTRKLQVLYGTLVGFFFAFQLPLGPIFFTPELALIAGNIFSYLVGSKQRVMLSLERVDKLSSTIYNYRFRSSEKLKFKAGQYAEWTLPHKNPDTRGNRRFFTIASSPTEDEILLGVRIGDDGSSFKKALLNLKVHDKISLGSLAGDFALPGETDKKLVFLAGGIGITPFRSILKYLIDKNEKRDIVLFHSCSNGNDFVYDDVIHDAEKKIGLQMHCLLSEKDDALKEFKGKFGHLTFEMLKQTVPDYKKRVFYISGSNVMVDMSKKTLKKAGVKKSNIRTDYFSGY